MSIKNGEIYKVADHIIACGDCLDPEFVSKVIGDMKIKAVITDPPYGVDYVKNKKDVARLGVKDPKEILGDHIQSEQEYEKFTEKWIKAVLPYLGLYNTFHIFNSDAMLLALRSGMRSSGLYFGQMLIWIKNQSVLGRKDYLPQFELIAYGWYGKHKLERSKAKSVIFHPKPNKSKSHPTQKPIGLLRKIIPNVTRIKDVVYDGFLGSGSTSIACHHLGRISVGIEIDPDYVEIAVSRMEKLTRSKRVLINKL